MNRIFSLKAFFLLFLWVMANNNVANAQLPIDVYGNLPSLRSMDISPDGKKLGYILRQDDLEALSIFDLESGQVIAGVRTDAIKARSMSFAGPDFALLRASETTRMLGFRGKFEFSAAFSFDLEKKKIRQLLRGNEDLFPAQSGLGDIAGLNIDGKTVYMPAYIGPASSDPSFGLMKVDLKTGRSRVYKRGKTYSRDYLVDTDGTLLAREDFNDKKDVYAIWASRSGDLKKIFEETDVELPSVALVGIKSDRSALIISRRRGLLGTSQLAEMGYDGTIKETLFSNPAVDVGRVLMDQNKFVIGVEYTGLFPTYEFFDKNMEVAVSTMNQHFSGAAVSLAGWSTDRSVLLFRVEGGVYAPSYYLYDLNRQNINHVANRYAEIEQQESMEVITVEYKARDGYKIPSVMTLPKGWSNEKRYPTIIMPHGGPESYDNVGFDWMAQYFASRGYLVLQPNFRGSTGFGARHRDAGRGGWGRGVMQHDVTDGLGAMIKAGWADPERVCIVGGSYGGYSALAGGAFTPDLYSCVVAIAPVVDVERMLFDERRDNGRDSWVVTYWKKLIGDPRSERDKLRNISPVNFASEFKAPVLLLHGSDDTVVPYRQSQMMNRALKKAGKDVTMVKLKGEDHWLSGGDTRLATLREMDRFINRIIGDQRNDN